MSDTYFKHERALVDEGAQIGEGTRIWAHAHIQKGAKIGSHCNVCDGSFVEKGAVVGNHVTIKHNVSIFVGVTIEDDVFIGSNIAFINDRRPRSNNTLGWTLEETHIKKGATLGANCVVMSNLTVGSYAMVGAGSVVTRDVPDYALIVGNPGRQIGYVCQCGEKLPDTLLCEKCNRKYKKAGKGLAVL